MKLSDYKILNPEEKPCLAVDNILKKMLKNSLPEIITVYHVDSYYVNDYFRFQGVFVQGGFIVQAPLSVLKHAKRYICNIIKVNDELKFSYTIWFDEKYIIENIL
jgi:hypothetical protein